MFYHILYDIFTYLILFHDYARFFIKSTYYCMSLMYIEHFRSSTSFIYWQFFYIESFTFFLFNLKILINGYIMVKYLVSAAFSFCWFISFTLYKSFFQCNISSFILVYCPAWENRTPPKLQRSVSKIAIAQVFI